MGSTVSVREMGKDWRVLGLPNTVPALREYKQSAHLGHKAVFNMGSSKLEANSNSCSSVDVIDLRRLRETLEHTPEGRRNKRVRRAGFTLLVLWCIISTYFAIATWNTVEQLNTIITEMRQTVKAVDEQYIKHPGTLKE